MIRSKGKTTSCLPCRLSWLLVEVNEDTKAEYYAIHSVEVNGDCNRAYLNRKVRFSQERRKLTGLIRLASDDLKIIEMEKERLTSRQKIISVDLEPFKADLWCLVRQTTDDTKVRLVIVSCKKLVCIESTDLNRKHFLMQKGDTQVPITLLHIIDVENQLFEEMAFLNTSFAQSCLCEEKDRLVEAEGLEEAFFLVQYFEDTNNLIFTIVRYKDTICKDENLFPNVVAYITDDDGKTISQCVILRKSFDKEELSKLLLYIRETCDSVDFPMLHAKLTESHATHENGQQEIKEV